jgi:hypothetical protein
VLGSTSIPFEGMRVRGEIFKDLIQSGDVLRDDLIQVVGKRPTIEVGLLDPTIVTGWEIIKSGGDHASINAHWLCYDDEGGLGSAYISLVNSLGRIHPVSLTASSRQKAIMQVRALLLFASGTAFTLGTSSGDRAAATKAFYPTSLTIGSAITALRDLTVNWDYTYQDDDALEPTYMYYDKFRMTGTATVRDLSEATKARIEDTQSSTVTALFTDANDGGNTASVALGTCRVQAEIDGRDCQLTFENYGN